MYTRQSSQWVEVKHAARCLEVQVDVLNENAVLEVGRQVRDPLDGRKHVAVHAEADGAPRSVPQRHRLRAIAHVAREIHVELQPEVVDLVVAELVAGEHEGRDEVGVAQPRAAAAARQEAEHVAHHVRERGARVRRAREQRRAVRRQVQTGAVLRAWVPTVLPLGPPVLHGHTTARRLRIHEISTTHTHTHTRLTALFPRLPR